MCLYSVDFPNLDLPNLNLQNLNLQNLNLQNWICKIWICKIWISKIEGYKKCASFCNVSVFLQPTRGKEVPDRKGPEKVRRWSRSLCLSLIHLPFLAMSSCPLDHFWRTDETQTDSLTYILFNLGNLKLWRKEKGNNFWRVVENDHHIRLKCLIITIWNRLSFNNTGNLIASQHLHRICACSSSNLISLDITTTSSSFSSSVSTSFIPVLLLRCFKL